MKSRLLCYSVKSAQINTPTTVAGVSRRCYFGQGFLDISFKLWERPTLSPSAAFFSIPPSPKLKSKSTRVFMPLSSHAHVLRRTPDTRSAKGHRSKGYWKATIDRSWGMKVNGGTPPPPPRPAALVMAEKAKLLAEQENGAADGSVAAAAAAAGSRSLAEGVGEGEVRWDWSVGDG